MDFLPGHYFCLAVLEGKEVEVLVQGGFAFPDLLQRSNLKVPVKSFDYKNKGKVFFNEKTVMIIPKNNLSPLFGFFKKHTDITVNINLVTTVVTSLLIYAITFN